MEIIKRNDFELKLDKLDASQYNVVTSDKEKI